MRAFIGGILTLVLSGVLIGVLGTSASAACETPWGSLRKGTLGDYSEGPLERVRTGRQACYDRLVVEVAGSGFGYRAEYVDQVVQEGSGKPVPLRGGAKLRVIVQAAAATGFPATSPELADVAGYTTFRQVAGAGSFESQTTIGVGVRARLPFRVLSLPRDGGGTRLVVDVAHAW
ncbi:MAG: AMIN-like domain-containing (lipo)protein [Spirillospora sp.]